MALYIHNVDCICTTLVDILHAWKYCGGSCRRLLQYMRYWCYVVYLVSFWNIVMREGTMCNHLLAIKAGFIYM